MLPKGYLNIRSIFVAVEKPISTPGVEIGSGVETFSAKNT